MISSSWQPDRWTKGQALMTAQIVEDIAPTKHAVRVNWFLREPGGSTIFVMPPDDAIAGSEPVAERGAGAWARY